MEFWHFMPVLLLLVEAFHFYIFSKMTEKKLKNRKFIFKTISGRFKFPLLSALITSCTVSSPLFPARQERGGPEFVGLYPKIRYFGDVQVKVQYIL